MVEVEELFTDYGMECPESLDFLSVAILLSENKGVDYKKRLSILLRPLLIVVMIQIKALSRNLSHEFQTKVLVDI